MRTSLFPCRPSPARPTPARADARVALLAVLGSSTSGRSIDPRRAPTRERRGGRAETPPPVGRRRSLMSNRTTMMSWGWGLSALAAEGECGSPPAVDPQRRGTTREGGARGGDGKRSGAVGFRKARTADVSASPSPTPATARVRENPATKSSPPPPPRETRQGLGRAWWPNTHGRGARGRWCNWAALSFSESTP